MKRKTRRNNLLESGNWKLAFVIILLMLAALAVGYVLGHAQAIDVCVRVGKRIADIQIDQDLLKDILARYTRFI